MATESRLNSVIKSFFIRATSSEFGTYRLCEQRRFKRACACAQSRKNLCCSLIQAVSQEEPSDRKPDPWSLWMAGHAQLKFVMTECSKTPIRLTGPIQLNISVIFQIMQMHCLQRRLRNTSISVTSVHPGLVQTEIGRDFTDSRLYKMFLGFNRLTGM